MLDHPRTSHFLRCGAAGAFWLALISGCAHRAAVSTWTPAGIDVAGLHKIAVLGFSGEHGEEVAAAVKSRLWDSEFYSLVDPGELNAIRWASATQSNRGLLSLDELQAARSAGVDGVLIGDVIEFRCDDRPETDEAPSWSARLLTQRPSADAQTADPANPPHDRRRRRREARVTVAFRLFDARTGSIRASTQISRTATAPADDQPNGPSVAKPDALLRDLVAQCVDEFVTSLAPHQVREHVQLASPIPFQSGFTLVQNGNEFAVRGRWEEAIAAWERAAAVNPENDAALFNLALANAGRQQFNRAESYAIRAMNVRQKPEYQAGLERIRKQAAAYDQTLQQRRDVTRPDFGEEPPQFLDARYHE